MTAAEQGSAAAALAEQVRQRQAAIDAAARAADEAARRAEQIRNGSSR